jgi:hypothetical protein
MDESGLFFWTLPTKSVNFKSDQHEDGKMSKDRITVAFFVMLKETSNPQKLSVNFLGHSAVRMQS